jgi:protein-L-isoaspartate(D-aspartate) O-methyltransferase
MILSVENIPAGKLMEYPMVKSKDAGAVWNWTDSKLTIVHGQESDRIPGVLDPQVLAAMRKIPRHLFVPADLQIEAYDDCALPIGKGQTISQPYMVGLMTMLLRLEGGEIVLEVGTGSGYQAAVLACIARKVISLERIPELCKRAEKTLAELQLQNVEVHCADGSRGYPDNAPYDGILVTAGAPIVPGALFDQLKPKGRLVIPVGERANQILQVWEQKDGVWHFINALPVAFVPLRGEAGWNISDWPENQE